MEAIAAVVLLALGVGIAVVVIPFLKEQLRSFEETTTPKVSEAIVPKMWQDKDLKQYLTAPDIKEWIASKVAEQKRELLLDHWLGELIAAKNEDLEPLRNAVNVEKITFPKSSAIDDNGLQYVRNLKLRELDISETGVQKLAPLKKMDSIRTLDVCKTHLDTDGMRVLGGLHNLENLFIGRTAVQDSDLELLKNLHNLKNLSLVDCSHITESGVQHLHSFLPNLNIIHDNELSAADLGGQPARQADKLFSDKKFAQAEGKYARILANLNEQAIPNNKAIAIILKKRADCCRLLKQYTRADRYYGQARELITQAEAPHVFTSILEGQALSLEAQFALNHDRKALLKAIQLREKSLAIYDDFHHYSLAEVDLMRLLGSDYALANEPAKAIKTLERAIPLFQTIHLGSSQQCGWTKNVLADILLGQGRFEEAEKYYKETEPIYRLNQPPMEPIFFQRLDTDIAYCEFKLKHYDKAEALDEKELAKQCNDKFQRLAQIDMMRQILLAQNKQEQAQVFAKQYADLAAQLPKSQAK